MIALSMVAFPMTPAMATNTAGVVTTYPGVTPAAITTGPDGALWFTNPGAVGCGCDSIGRITTAGVVSTFTGFGISNPYGITAGRDGALWFTNIANNSIGRITTSGKVKNYTGSGINSPGGIAAGPDGALWFTNAGNNSIGRITTTGAVTNYTDPSINVPFSITTGPDGALWFTNSQGFAGSIGRITTAGAVSKYTAGAIFAPQQIAAGPDGALWFTNIFHGAGGAIGRITTSGTVSMHGDGGTDPAAIASGPDGALWFTDGGDQVTDPFIGEISTAGVVTSYTGAFGSDITAGPDGNMWFADPGFSVGRITTADSITTLPLQGHSGTALAVTGSGFSAGETVKVKYSTGLSTPAGVLLCSATVAGDGTFSCAASIPVSAGPTGTHTITARGKTSGTKAKMVFLLTT